IMARALTAAFGIAALVQGLRAADDDLIPKQFAKEQRDTIQRFLQEHEKPKEYVPPNAKIVGAPPDGTDAKPENKPDQIVKQYLVQITPHRPVPGQEQVK